MSVVFLMETKRFVGIGSTRSWSHEHQPRQPSTIWIRDYTDRPDHFKAIVGLYSDVGWVLNVETSDSEYVVEGSLKTLTFKRNINSTARLSFKPTWRLLRFSDYTE